jgi:hypothetical protein
MLREDVVGRVGAGEGHGRVMDVDGGERCEVKGVGVVAGQHRARCEEGIARSSLRCLLLGSVTGEVNGDELVGGDERGVG